MSAPACCRPATCPTGHQLLKSGLSMTAFLASLPPRFSRNQAPACREELLRFFHRSPKYLRHVFDCRKCFSESGLKLRAFFTPHYSRALSQHHSLQLFKRHHELRECVERPCHVSNRLCIVLRSQFPVLAAGFAKLGSPASYSSMPADVLHYCPNAGLSSIAPANNWKTETRTGESHHFPRPPPVPRPACIAAPPADMMPPAMAFPARSPSFRAP